MMKLKSLNFLAVSFFVSTLGMTSSALGRTDNELKVTPLAEARSALKPETYTAKQRELMAKQALFFIEKLYVHRELKIKDFGAGSDPVPRLKDMVKRAPTMSDSDFHAAMQKIFADLHDFHTNYIAPLPLRCSYVLAPLNFIDVYDNNSLKIIVRNRSRILASVAPEAATAKPGDELIAINDVPIKQLFETLKQQSGGANEDAMVVNAIMKLTIIGLDDSAIPANDNIKYTLKRGSETINIDSQYYALVNEPNCVKSVQEANELHSFPNINLFGNEFPPAENPILKVYKDLIEPQVSGFFGDEEALPVGKIYGINTPAGNFLKFDFETFVPNGKVSADGVIHKIKTILEKSQPNTDALIIDLRGNGGGLITLAEGLTQLFTPNKIKPMPVRLLPNEVNLAMFLNSNLGHENGWSSDTKEAMANGSKYTKLRPIISDDAANRYGQVWFKPVVILTDAKCYSACDLFAAAMQDHAGAKIIGIHKSTGAGGANVMEYNVFKMIFDVANPAKNPFLKLPGSQNMRVSWRQTIRVGKNEGAAIEDAGVKSDVVIRMQSEDVIAGESHLLMHQIAEEISKIIPRYKSNITLGSSLKMANNESALWIEKVRGIDKLEVSDENGKVIKTFKISTDEQDVKIDLPSLKGHWSERKLILLGKLKNQAQFRVAREVRWRGDAIPVGTLVEETFEGNQLKYLHTEQSAGPTGEGWQVRKNALVVGGSDHYAANVVTQVFAMLNTENASKVSLRLDMELETESNMDFVNLIIRDPNSGNEYYAASFSGTQVLKDAGVVFNVGGAPEIEIVLEFTSDENWHMRGPQINSFSLKAQ